MSQARVILMAEDSRADVLLAQRAFRNLTFPYKLQMVEHGDAVVEYLTGKGDYHDRDRYPFPNLLLMDLKMPRRSGFEVMEWLQQHPQLQLPIVVLTTSNNQNEIDRAYKLGAKLYLLKPITFTTLSEIIKFAEID